MKISVVIPMYNASKTIRLCLEALSLQEILPQEVIVVDNNSTDNCREIVEECKEHFKHLNIILCEESKQGYGAPRNKGARVAVGEIIAFTDTDCLADKFWVKNILSAFSQDKDLGIVGGIDKALVLPSTAIGKLLSAFWLTADNVKQSFILKKEDFLDNKCVIGFNCAFKRDLYNKLNGCDEKITNGEETDLVMRALDAGAKIIAWHKEMVVGHYHDISFKKLIKREFNYTKGFVFVVSRHIQNSIYICFGSKHFGWRNKIGMTLVLSSVTTKIFSFLLFLLLVAYFSLKLMCFILFIASIYLCVRIKELINRAGSCLTIKETFLALFFYLARAISKFYGRMYWSFYYKIICV